MKKILFGLLILINCVIFSNANNEAAKFIELRNKIKNNIKSSVVADEKFINRLADISAMFVWIINTPPEIKIEPQAIMVSKYGEVQISTNRKLVIFWKDPLQLSKDPLLTVTADVVPNLIQTKKNSSLFRAGLFLGVSFIEREDDENSISFSTIGLSFCFFDIASFELSTNILYNDQLSFGIGIGYRFNSIFSTVVGVSTDGSQAQLYFGVNTRIF